MPFSLRAAALAAVLAPLVCAQNITVDDTTIAANESTVAAAAETVSTASNASSSLFSSESVQLTDSVLANLTDLDLTAVDLFAFGSDNTSSDAAAKRSLDGRGSTSCCKVYPGDKLYPSSAVWKVLGLLLGKNTLIKTVPLAAPCFSNWGVQDATECAFITNNWVNDSYMHADDPTSVMWPLYEGATCMPTGDDCTLGGYPSYAVAVTNVAQIQLAVNFARNANLRLVVKNTGHDFNGKSAGAGALSIWTHNLKDIQFYDTITQGNYTGPAIKAGSGVQAFEFYAAAYAHNVTVVGGEGKSVGVSGGFMYGGGHSPLSSLHGMASDQILSMEIVLPSGQFVTASNTSNPDLFWALRGGGGGTYGVVTSVTVKAYPKTHVSGATWNFAVGTNVSADLFWEGTSRYLARLPEYVDAGCYTYFQILQTATDVFYFGMAPFFAPGKTAAELEELVAPLMAEWADLGIPINSLTYTDYDDFYLAWDSLFPLESVGEITLKTASRLFPRANFEPVTGNATLFNATVDAIRSTVSDGATVLAFNIKANPAQGYPDSAVNPAWRETVLHAIQAILWDEGSNDTVIAEASLKLTNDWMQQWRDVSPDAGAYMSEADILEPNFQQAFYGLDNYARLLKLKNRYDPWGLFYAPTGVGSESWYITGQIDGLPTQNGRLCKV